MPLWQHYAIVATLRRCITTYKEKTKKMLEKYVVQRRNAASAVEQR